MAITAVRCVGDFNRKYQRLSGRNSGEVRLEEKMALLNEALDDYFEYKVQMFDVDSSVRAVLRPVEYKNIKLSKKKSDKFFDIFELSSDFYRVMRRNVLAFKEGCGEKEIVPLVFQTDDLEASRKSPYWRSSFEWEHIMGDEGREGLYLWHEGDFKIEDVWIDYVKKPEELKAASLHEDGRYIDVNGELVVENNVLQLGGNSHNDIVNLAVFYHMVAIGDGRDMQSNIQKILNKEDLVKKN